MSTLRQLGAAAVLTAIGFTRASAQPVIGEPAYCEFLPIRQLPEQGSGQSVYRPQLSAPWRPEFGPVAGVRRCYRRHRAEAAADPVSRDNGLALTKPAPLAAPSPPRRSAH
jgi:hypothetical protein